MRIAALALVAASCAHAPPLTLQTGRAAISSAWQPIDVEGATLALHHRDGGALGATVTCDKSNDGASLDVLTNHLLMDLEARHEHGRHPTVIDGRAALRTRIGARLDGVPVEMDLVVLRKDGCVVDAELVAAPEKIDAREPDFNRFVSGLALTRGGP